MQEERNPDIDEAVEGHRPHNLDESDDEVEAHRFNQAEEPGYRKRSKPDETGRRFGPDEPGRRF
jgi:hypothetical protein